MRSLCFVFGCITVLVAVACQPTASPVPLTPVTPAPTLAVRESAPISQTTNITATTITTPTAIATPAQISTTVAATATELSSPAPMVTATLVSTSTVSTATASVATVNGLEIYRKQYCGICHQSTAAGTAGTFGPSHDGMGAIAEQRLQEANYQGTATTAAEYLHESLIDPQRYIVPTYELSPHRMPAYTHLSEPELAALVQWLLQQ